MKTLITFILLLQFQVLLIAQNFWQDLLPPTVYPQSLDVSSNGNLFVIWDCLLLRSSDSGQTWDSLFTGSTYAIDFLTSPTGPIYLFAVDSVRKSVDEGNSWAALENPFYPMMGYYFYTTNHLGYMFIQNLYIYGNSLRSTDEGNSWDLIGFDTCKVVDIGFKNDLTFATFYCNNSGNFYKSADYGLTWKLLPNAPTGLSTLFMSKSGKLFAGIDGPNSLGNLFFSSDDGETWTMVSELTGISIRDIEENQLGHIYLATLNGVFRSTDDGISWQQINSGLNSDQLWCQRLTVDSSGFVYVTSGTAQMLYRSVESTTSVEKENLVANTFILKQNYPNPFNPSTKIKYSISQSSNVELKVFDVLGNEIETLVNEEKSVGTYEITWYAENLPSGVYFYQLKAGDYVNTKKMVLVK